MSALLDLDELLEEAARDVAALVAAWPPPSVEWPVGTTVAQQGSDFFDRPEKPIHHDNAARYHLVTLPSGGQLITLTQPGRVDERGVRDYDQPWADGRAPHVLYSVMVDPTTSTVYAIPRVANMSIRASRRREDYARHAWLPKELGLAERYEVGRLPRPIESRTRTVVVGWTYRGTP